MADGIVGVREPNSPSKLIDNEELTVNSQTVQRQRVNMMNSLVPSQYDFVDLAYTSGRLSSVVFKRGGSGGTVIRTVALTYDGQGNLDTVTAT